MARTPQDVNIDRGIPAEGFDESWLADASLAADENETPSSLPAFL
jgi:hypothetical protein